ncbi:hypothetical protein TRIUR3_28675 [Triticum urartu]|uniref:Uncharacterized protein n=1 Tax=Triticum urartu TaxID=4572 RepID=M7ZXR6_TRIUA|nr:hypothetical protein TRIUR3_28675 [Triticum urartu]
MALPPWLGFRAWAKAPVAMSFSSRPIARTSIDQFIMSSKTEKRHGVPWLEEMHMSEFLCIAGTWFASLHSKIQKIYG